MCDNPATLLHRARIVRPSTGLAVVDSMASQRFKAFLAFFRAFYAQRQ
jgi:hypothetical protein